MSVCFNLRESKFIFVLEDVCFISVFVGYDHVRRTSKTYSSYDKKKLLSLAGKMAKDNNLPLIIENKPTLLFSN